MKSEIKDDWVIKGLKEKIEKIDNAIPALICAR